MRKLIQSPHEDDDDVDADEDGDSFNHRRPDPPILAHFPGFYLPRFPYFARDVFLNLEKMEILRLTEAKFEKRGLDDEHTGQQSVKRVNEDELFLESVIVGRTRVGNRVTASRIAKQLLDAIGTGDLPVAPCGDADFGIVLENERLELRMTACFGCGWIDVESSTGYSMRHSVNRRIENTLWYAYHWYRLVDRFHR